MSFPKVVLAKIQRIGFGVSLLLLLLTVACDSDDDAVAPTAQSTTEVLLGEWALVRITGGIAGIDESYTIENSPQSITFRDDATVLVESNTDMTTSQSSYFVQEVTSRNDTTFFSFGAIRENQSFFLGGRQMYLVGPQILETELICCDFFDYRFEKL